MYTVSFGRKIPFAQVYIKDKQKDKFVPATIYEMDCTSQEDMYEVLRAKGDWAYKDSIVRNMNTKYALKRFRCADLDNNQRSCSIFGERTYPDSALSLNRFYVTQLEDSSIIGMSQVHNKNDNLYIDFIERKKGKRYKYFGQTLLAALGQDLIHNEGNKIVINSPVDSALPFYIDKCKFTKVVDDSLMMDKKQIKKLIKKTQKKTKSPIINLNA